MENLNTNEIRIENKELVVKKFKKIFDEIEKPLAFLVYGSVGRGTPNSESDIDSILIFPDQDISFYVNNDFVGQLPFDERNSELFDEADKKDLIAGSIDFLRIRGTSGGESVELQLFPISSIHKATNIFASELVAGTKQIDGNYVIPDDSEPRPTLNFKGERVYFNKNPRLSESAKRIDISEISTRRHEGAWIRGLTLGKLLTPKVMSDRININEYLDEHVLVGVIKALLYNLNLYFKDPNGKIIGVNQKALDYKTLFTLLRSHKTEEGVVEEYEFGKEEEEHLRERYETQIKEIIKRNNYKIIEESND